MNTICPQKCPLYVLSRGGNRKHFIGTGAALLLLWVFDFQLIAALVSCLIIVLISGIVTLRVMADSIRQSRYKL